LFDSKTFTHKRSFKKTRFFHFHFGKMNPLLRETSINFKGALLRNKLSYGSQIGPILKSCCCSLKCDQSGVCSSIHLEAVLLQSWWYSVVKGGPIRSWRSAVQPSTSIIWRRQSCSKWKQLRKLCYQLTDWPTSLLVEQKKYQQEEKRDVTLGTSSLNSLISNKKCYSTAWYFFSSLFLSKVTNWNQFEFWI